MLLCLDIGNTHILGGVFRDDQLQFRFRYATHLIGTSDQFGVFLLNIMQVHGVPLQDIEAVSLCSVVPSYDYTIRHTLTQYIKAPVFMLQAGVKTGLNIKYKNPNEVGADKIANAIAALAAFPDKNIIIADLSTATTLCALTKQKDYLGGTILPGIKLGMESLRLNTAKLMEVDIEAPDFYLGRTIRESLQSGLYYGQLGALKELIAGFKKQLFTGQNVLVIGTGSFARLYQPEDIFDVVLPDLVLQGLLIAYQYSCLSKVT